MKRRKAELSDRRRKLTEAIHREDERFRRRSRNYRAAREAADAAGEPMPEPPVPTNLADDLRAVNNEEDALREERRAALREMGPRSTANSTP